MIILFFSLLGYLEYLYFQHQNELAKLVAQCIENAQATNTDPENCKKITN